MKVSSRPQPSPSPVPRQPTTRFLSYVRELVRTRVTRPTSAPAVDTSSTSLSAGSREPWPFVDARRSTFLHFPLAIPSPRRPRAPPLLSAPTRLVTTEIFYVVSFCPDVGSSSSSSSVVRSVDFCFSLSFSLHRLPPFRRLAFSPEARRNFSAAREQAGSNR